MTRKALLFGMLSIILFTVTVFHFKAKESLSEVALHQKSEVEVEEEREPIIIIDKQSLIKYKKDTTENVVLFNQQKTLNVNINSPTHKKEHSNKNIKDENIVYNKISLFSVERHEQAPSNIDFSTYGEPIAINSQEIINLKEKQVINFPLDGGIDLYVTKTEKRKSGSVKVNFLLTNEAKIYRGFITIGKRSTLGRMITPSGSYELEVVNGKGWIVDTRKIDKKIPKDGIDYIIPNT
jgi:hypothetical protein